MNILRSFLFRTLVPVSFATICVYVRDLDRANRAILSKFLHCSRAAQREERNGFKYTAAMKWRSAAELFAPDARAAEYCWCKWERIMQLPRRLARPFGAGPTIVRVVRHRNGKKLADKNF